MTQAIVEQLDKEIRKKIESEVRCEQVTGNATITRICYSKTEKESKSGIMHNDRILLMYVPESLGYVNKLDDKVKLPLSDKPLPLMKLKIPLRSVTFCKHT